MSGRETTTTHPLGWPTPGSLTVRDGRPQIPVEYGDGTRDWADDAAWARACSAAWATAAGVLEAERDRRIVDGPARTEETPVVRGLPPAEQVWPAAPPAAPEPVPLAAPAEGFSAFQPADPTGVPCPRGCGQLVYPSANGLMHRVQGGTAAACPPEDQNPTSVFPRIEAAL